MTTGLLLLHAFPLDATMWKPQLADLAGEAAIVAPSLPGFGGEPAGDEALTIDSAADFAAERLRAAGLDQAVVCGLSMGGYVALALWRRHRGLVAGLVLANTRSGADDDAGRERREQLAARLRSEGSGFMLESPPPLLLPDAAPELWDGVKAIIAGQPAESIARASLAMAARPDATADLPGITVPCLVVSSANDSLIPPDATRPMADAIPGARYVELPRAGHLSNLEQPAAFTQLLRDELRRAGA